MSVFYTSSVESLVKKMKVSRGRFIISRFSDGEINVKIKEPVHGRNVWVIAAANAPADNMIELVLLLDALKRAGAKISLLITYLGYARQDKPLPGEPLSAEVICHLLRTCRPSKVLVLHAHSARSKKFLRYQDIIPIEIYGPTLKGCDAIIAPDKGSASFARSLAKRYSLECQVMHKTRPKKEQVLMGPIDGDVKGKQVLIVDDMVTTGKTLVAAARVLHKKGALKISALVTHGVFAPGAMDLISKSPISNIYVTDSLPQGPHKKKVIIGISSWIKQVMKAR